MRFSRVAIVNRGEPAMRFINAVKDYRSEHDADLSTIALYTTPDRESTFVSEADRAYNLGPALVDDGEGGRLSAYVHHPTLRQALEETGADAVWTGWGFVAEDADFAEMCERLGIVAIGPNARTMRILGDKIASKRLAEQSDVPVAAWSGGPVETIEEATLAANEIGYPLLLKATAGGGGRGIRRIGSPEDLSAAFEPARREAGVAFGNPTVFLESLVPDSRHIEVQIVGDETGAVWAVGVRDCSVQRRNQKVIEEAPSPVLTDEQHREVCDAAARLGRAVGYENVGTVEFLYQPAHKRFSFMEVNTRLQVEHPITEVTTGVDLVKLQLALALGEVLQGEPPVTEGHAIEVRLNAEDPESGFAPAPGAVALLSIPFGPGVRVDTGIEEGDEVVAEYDSMIAKIITHGSDRNEAAARMKRALAQTTTVIRGGATNKGFVQALMDHPDYAGAAIDVGWIDRMIAAGERLEHQHMDVALLAGGLAGYEHQVQVERVRFRASAARGRPEIEPSPSGRQVALRYGGTPYSMTVACVGPRRYRIGIDGCEVSVHAVDAGLAKRLTIGDRSYKTLSVVHGAAMQVEVDGVGHRISFDEGGIVRSPSPALVVSINVAPGDEVLIGDRLAVIEAMKMETNVYAEFSGVVREVVVHPNIQVAAGSPLVVIDLTESDDAAGPADRVAFAGLAEPAEPAHRRCAHVLGRLRNAMLGFDIDPGSLVEEMSGARRCPHPGPEDERLRAENEILGLFADLIALFRRDPIDDEAGGPARRGAETHLFDYLRNVEAQGADQPEWFNDLLRKAMSHYGFDSLEPSTALSAALFRLLRARSAVAALTPALTSILEDRIESPGASEGPELRRLLDRLADETIDRYPVIHDLAVDIRYRLFDFPFLEDVRARAFREADERIARLEADPLGDDRAEHINALLHHPQPLAPTLTRRMRQAPPAVRAALLEVTSRRYYRMRALEDVQSVEAPEGVLLGARYEFEGSHYRLTATAVSWENLESRLNLVAESLTVESDQAAVIDVYVTTPPDEGDADSLAETVSQMLRKALGGRRVGRVVITALRSDTATSIASVFHFTFRPDPDGGFSEDRQYRDLHPMMAKRLVLGRLANFDTVRIPTLEDIYLFHGKAKDNPRDERLFAVAEVRDATKVTDPDGRTRIPDMERVFREVVASIRRFQAKRPRGRRLIWNRIILYIWPKLDMSREELFSLITRLAPYAHGAGLERVVLLLRVTKRGETTREVLEIRDPWGRQPTLKERDDSIQPIRALSSYRQRMTRLRQRGLVDPYELVRLLTRGAGMGGALPPGDFGEHDLEGAALVEVERKRGGNEANVVVGVISNRTARYPEGMRRVLIAGDPSRGMGNLAEPECSRIIAALDLAERLGVPVEWFAVSAGARISMDSGTENMDWIGRVLRRIVEFTQAGGEINVVVTGINVGAQPYWNAEATMLMHTKGILVMTPSAAMVLTGKEALDFSGGVSAEDNFGIGGFDRIMGPNGQAQYYARDVHEACRILLQHYEFSYVAPGERFPRRAETTDPVDRDAGAEPHGGEFGAVGEIFSDEANPDRKRPFEIRRVMGAAVDQDLPTLERWHAMQHGEVAVVWDAFLGGSPVCLIGLESKPVTRTGFVPADGPDQWTAGTLFPVASKKVARAINSASGSRPVVVLANLSGFDGSPESMRRRQLEYGAEIGRAVVNFDGPIVFCVISRYHGGAFVVFSKTLNESMEVAALEGSKASVIGGAPAAGVVFAREVSKRVEEDPRVKEAVRRASAASDPDKPALTAEAKEVRAQAHAEHLHRMADDFDAIHSVERALDVGSVDRIIASASLRPYLIDAVERGMERTLADMG